MSDQSIADRAWQVFLSTAWRPDFDGSAADDAPSEDRGNTHWGVTRATWITALAHFVIVSDTNFDTAPQSDFAAVLRWACWRLVWGDQIAEAGAPGVAVVLANMAMAAGASRAVRIMQGVLHVPEDGMMGPVTVASVGAAVASGRDLIGELTRADVAFFASLVTAPMYLKGWTRRAEVFDAVARGL